MPMVIGHSQTKYLSGYLPEEEYSVFSYPGYRVRQFIDEDVIFEVVPFFSVVILVVGANDIGYRSPADIVSGIEALCTEIRRQSPSVTVLVSEVLPRCQNLFEGHQLNTTFLDNWNREAAFVNRSLHTLSSSVSWIEIIRQSDFHTMFGAKRKMFSKDGLHLSFDGTDSLSSNIMDSVELSSPVPAPPMTPVPASPMTPVPASPMTPAPASPMTPAPASPMTPLPAPPMTPVPAPPMTPASPMTPLPAPPMTPVPAPPMTPVPAPPMTPAPASPTTKAPAVVSPPTTKAPAVVSQRRKNPDKVVLIETDTKYVLSSDCFKLVGGGNETPIFSNTDRCLTHNEAADILVQNLPNSVTYDPPYRPASGTVFLYDDSGDPNRKEDWRADGYTWKNNGRRVYTTVEGKQIERTFFKIRNQNVASDKFLKSVFRFPDETYNGRTLIVYIGDTEAYKGLPHGNRKKNARQYKMTKPSVLKDITSRGLQENPKTLKEFKNSQTKRKRY